MVLGRVDISVPRACVYDRWGDGVPWWAPRTLAPIDSWLRGCARLTGDRLEVHRLLHQEPHALFEHQLVPPRRGDD